jgi:hypothetical protein
MSRSSVSGQWRDGLVPLPLLPAPVGGIKIRQDLKAFVHGPIHLVHFPTALHVRLTEAEEDPEVCILGKHIGAHGEQPGD